MVLDEMMRWQWLLEVGSVAHALIYFLEIMSPQFFPVLKLPVEYIFSINQKEYTKSCLSMHMETWGGVLCPIMKLTRLFHFLFFSVVNL